MVHAALAADGVMARVHYKFLPVTKTMRFENCSTAFVPEPRSDCYGSRVEACVASEMCDPWCPIAVASFIAQYEGPYPEGPGGYDGCGGSLTSCLLSAGFSQPEMDAIGRCVSNDTAAAAAMHAAEAQSVPAVTTGKGFPQLYVNGEYYDNTEGVLLALCADLASAAPPGSDEGEVAEEAKWPPAACRPFDFIVNLEVRWPRREFRRRVLETVVKPALDTAITKAIGGLTVVDLVETARVSLPADDADGVVRAEVRCRVATGFASAALTAPGGAYFPQLLAAQLAQAGNSSFANITAGDIRASAAPWAA